MVKVNLNNSGLEESLDLIFDKMNKQGLNYCILRNYKNLDLDDIDILILKSDLKKVVNFLLNEGFIIKSKNKFDLHMVFFKEGSFIVFDIKTSIHFNNLFSILDSKIILKNKVKYHNFYIPCAEDYFLLLLFHSIIDKGYFKAKYKKEIKAILCNELDFNYINSLAKKLIFPSKFMRGFIKNPFPLFSNPKLIKKIRQNIFLNNIRKPISFLNLLLHFFKWPFMYVSTFGRGVSIAIVGPDGTGKTTLINELSKKLKLGHYNVSHFYMGAREHINPLTRLIVSLVKSRNKNQNKKSRSKSIIKNHGSQLSSSFSINNLPTSISPDNLPYIRSLFNALIYVVELSTKYLVILPSLYRKKVILFDRYIFDILAERSLKKHSFLKFLVLHIFPSPDFTFYVKNDIHTLFSRKPELSAEELKLYNKRYYKLLNSVKNYHVIMGNQTPKVISNEMLSVSWKKIAKKIKHMKS
jgi:thymidylate kinase